MLRLAFGFALALLLASPCGASRAAASGGAAEARVALQLAQAARDEREAAQLAARQHGGKVLRVQRQGSNYEVRLLMPEGGVRHVVIAGSTQAGRS